MVYNQLSAKKQKEIIQNNISVMKKRKRRGLSVKLQVTIPYYDTSNRQTYKHRRKPRHTHSTKENGQLRKEIKIGK